MSMGTYNGLSPAKVLLSENVIACSSINCSSEAPLDSYQEPISISSKVH